MRTLKDKLLLTNCATDEELPNFCKGSSQNLSYHLERHNFCSWFRSQLYNWICFQFRCAQIKRKNRFDLCFTRKFALEVEFESGTSWFPVISSAIDWINGFGCSSFIEKCFSLTYFSLFHNRWRKNTQKLFQWQHKPLHYKALSMLNMSHPANKMA